MIMKKIILTNVNTKYNINNRKITNKTMLVITAPVLFLKERIPRFFPLQPLGIIYNAKRLSLGCQFPLQERNECTRQLRDSATTINEFKV